MMNRLPSRRPSRSHLTVEVMEDRSVPAGLSPAAGFTDGPVVANVYVETNNPAAGQNAVLGFHRAADGSLTQFGTFPTGGTGQLNIPKVVGPDDGDQEVRATADGRFLFAVNEGSSSITAFRIAGNGRLDRIGTVSTNGVQPDSIGIAGDRLYVANRGDAAAGHPGTVAPGITGFDIGRDGALTPIPNSTVTFPVGTFVTQTLISRDGRFLFAEVASLQDVAQANTIAPFRIKQDGTLALAPGGNVAAGTNTGIILGAVAHPSLNIVYSGITAASQIGVFTYDETGRTSFVGASADQGLAPCWITISPDGRVLYAANTATNSIGVYSLADPLHPVQIQDLALGGPQSAGGAARQTAVFQISLDPTGHTLYAVGQSTDPAFGQGNQLHILSVARDGTLTESKTGPIIFSPVDVPADAHPQGIAVVAVADHDRHGEDDDSSAGRHNGRHSEDFDHRGRAAGSEFGSVRIGGGVARFDLGDGLGGLFADG